ncbi:DCAF12 [Bugula neritina]|uniref:DCAF12 n=1 Tax=Bugula neritina TaxID=10212 RepID=A0A7J7J0B3_BUGNE|nr:DCAF12 [Bugula neritina]
MRVRLGLAPTDRLNRNARKFSNDEVAKLLSESVSEESAQMFDPKRLSLFKHVLNREIYGLNHRAVKAKVTKHLSMEMPALFTENELDLGSVNKVFTSQWINDSQVIMGTKCNKLLIKNVYTDDIIKIPSLQGSGTVTPADCPCGIHAISINPSKTMLATGAEHTNCLAVYRLPSFDPLLVGENGHSDWIFDLTWIDDEYCVTGSRDSRLAIWKVEDLGSDESSIGEYITQSGAIPSFDHKVTSPTEVKTVMNAEKIRALAYNQQGMELGILSLNSKIHTWDVCTFQQKETARLQYTRETVCLAYDPTRQLYAVGSQSHVSLLDRNLKSIFSIESLTKGFGIRSVSFNHNVITIGTGVGNVLFYDMNAGKYRECKCGHTCVLRAGSGYLKRDNTWREYFSDHDYQNAIYTHCYDDTGLRLFTAGGPLPAGLVGNYAGVWQ